jgi:hypothetical protein
LSLQQEEEQAAGQITREPLMQVRKEKRKTFSQMVGVLEDEK